MQAEIYQVQPFPSCTGDANPSPNSYSLPVLLGPHIPNRVSSACYSMPGRPKIGGIDMDYAKTPGPGRYGVTTPETFQRKSPAYSMLGRSYMPGGEHGGYIAIRYSSSACGVSTPWAWLIKPIPCRRLICTLALIMAACVKVDQQNMVSHAASWALLGRQT